MYFFWEVTVIRYGYSKYLNSPYRGFFRDVVKTRARYIDYVMLGCRMRPPKLIGDIPVLSSKTISSPGVLSAMWLGKEEALLLVNCTEEELTFSVQADGYQSRAYTLKPLEMYAEVLD